MPIADENPPYFEVMRFFDRNKFLAHPVLRGYGSRNITANDWQPHEIHPWNCCPRDRKEQINPFEGYSRWADFSQKDGKRVF